ncbi:hypothetical protein [Acinetobacter rudis]|uniref:Outer membrane protein beta-barrel domain-containing protein n=1 Tax=Acinetobacter rudis TaxID=632955 RepID=A0AAW8J4L2_9GAMM|nr:hypothetical protein [Acinetobacter rudis]MDQ8934549.1 hypothetical protein [Acinetobacter rudis]MDQ8951688.1 hypothetical protein [Acinetobacter rudis]MDQ9016881.1 hypothetical protein [Acinetobacter rudis]
MKKVHQAIALLGLTLLCTTTTFAKSALSVRAEGGVSGYGAAVLYHVHPSVNFALGYNGGDMQWDNSLKIAGITTDLNVDNDLSFFNANIHPWGNSDNRWLSALYTSVGVGYVNNKYHIHHTFKPGEKRPGLLNLFSKKKALDVKGYIDYTQGISPYCGFGFSPQLNKHWGAFAEVGLYYVGEAKAHITHVKGINIEGLMPNQSVFKLEGNDYVSWSPVAKMGLTYRF